VRLAYERGATEQRREGLFTRREVQIKSIPLARIVDREQGIAYIQMTGFQSSTARELDEALARLQAQGMRALIWDLRGNPGGLLPTAVEVLDRFIEDGVLVSTRGRTADQNFQYFAHRAGTWKLPLVLLVDGDSASASEIVAGAIRDHHRGTIVGRQTFGKWSVQSIVQMQGSAGLRLTTAKFYAPRGETLGKIGVAPDRVVELAEPRETYYRGPEDLSPDRDPDLREGLEVLRRQIAQR
jgi:carboxyl-terminal processing protease